MPNAALFHDRQTAAFDVPWIRRSSRRMTILFLLLDSGIDHRGPPNKKALPFAGESFFFKCSATYVE